MVKSFICTNGLCAILQCTISLANLVTCFAPATGNPQNGGLLTFNMDQSFAAYRLGSSQFEELYYYRSSLKLQAVSKNPFI